MVPPNQVAAQNESGPHPYARIDKGQTLERAPQKFRPSSTVGVVVDHHRQLNPAGQGMGEVPVLHIDIREVVHMPRLVVDHPRQSDTDSKDSVGDGRA